MSLAALIRSMAEAGAPAEAIALAVEAIELREAADAERKAKTAERKRNERERTRLSQDMDVTVTTQSQDGPATIPDNAATIAEGSPRESKETLPPSQSPLKVPLSHPDALQIWNEMAIPLGLPPALTATGKRQAMLRQRLAEHGEEGYRKAAAAIGRSKFCQGQNDRGWRADIGFMLRPDNFVKLIEGGYDPIGKLNGHAPPRRTIADVKRGIARAEDLNDPDRVAELKAELAAMTELSADANVAHLVQAAAKNLRMVGR